MKNEKMGIYSDKKKRFEKIFIIGIAAVLFIYLFSNIYNINIIWELPDEAGYLYNITHFLGENWSSYANNGRSYYGYGYSLILIPVYLLSNNGVELVKQSILVNYILIVLTYFLQVYVLSKLFKRCSLYLVALSAFVASLFPYAIVSANKVLCETFLSFQVWLIAAILYKLFDTNKKIYYGLLGGMSIYIYQTHTRALAVLIVICSLLLIHTFINRDKKAALFFCVLLVMYFIGNIVKRDIINSFFHESNTVNNDKISNVLDFDFVIKRLSWLFDVENIGAYIVSACCRFYYVIVSTGLTVFWALRFMWRKTLGKIRTIKEWKACNWTLFYFFCIFFLMFIFCCLSGSGVSSDFTYVFYGRYLEYVLSPLIGIGILGFLSESKSESTSRYILIVLLCIGIISGMEVYYLDSDSVRADTARIAGFSFWILKNDDYRSFVYSQTLLLTIEYMLLSVLKNGKKNLIFLLVAGLFLLNDKECIRIINNVNEGKSKEIAIAEYINGNIDNETIFFINMEYDYRWNYARIQELLLHEQMEILDTDCYNDYILGEAFIIAYANTKVAEDLAQHYELILNAGEYVLYRN